MKQNKSEDRPHAGETIGQGTPQNCANIKKIKRAYKVMQIENLKHSILTKTWYIIKINIGGRLENCLGTVNDKI